MTMGNKSFSIRTALSAGLLLSAAWGTSFGLAAQAQTPTPAASVSQLGTVKAVTGSTVTLATDAGQSITVMVPADAKVVQLAVGSTDLKSAKPSQFSDVAVGDRVLASGKPGDTPGALTAKLVVVMKSVAIAQMQAAQQEDWKVRGTGGIVSSVDAAKGIILLQSGSKKLTINTTSATKFRRFEGGSVQYEDSKPGTLSQVQPKDQLQVLGNKSADGLTIQAEEVMSGSFLNLSGLLTSIDPVAGTITFKDLATKKIMTVNVTAKSDMHSIPLQTATMLAMRSNGGGRGGGRGGRGGNGGGDTTASAAAAPVNTPVPDAALAAIGVDSTLGTTAAGAGATGAAAGTTAQEDAAGGFRRSAGADISSMMPRLPVIKLTDLKIGDAVMVVASEQSPGASTVDVITLLSGVEPILTANPNGGMSLGMSVGGGGGGGGE